MTTTTDPTALLAEAAAKVWIEDVPMGVPESIAQAILAASPTLARALAIGTAWLAAEEALPEGFEGPYVGPRDRRDDFEAEAFASNHAATRAVASTPEAALLALADALRKERGA